MTIEGHIETKSKEQSQETDKDTIPRQNGPSIEFLYQKLII